MYRGMKAPAKNKNGLVIPPVPIKVSPEIAESKGKKTIPDRHHIYFPKVSFVEAGKTAFQFREHRFNSIWLPRFQHEKIHRRYDPLVREYPSFFLPSEEVMGVFLDEAKILEDLDVNVRAVDMIDDAIYEDRITDLDRTLEHREARLENVSDGLRRFHQIEIIPRHIRQPFMALGRICIETAA